MIRLAGVFLRDGQAFVACYSPVEMGWLETDVFHRDKIDFSEIAELTLRAFEATRSDVPTPKRDEFGSRLPDLAGVKSYRSFMKGTLNVSVQASDDGTYLLYPKRNMGKDGHKPITDKSFTIDAVDGLAAAIERAFELTE